MDISCPLCSREIAGKRRTGPPISGARGQRRATPGFFIYAARSPDVNTDWVSLGISLENPASRDEERFRPSTLIITNESARPALAAKLG